MNVLMIGVDKTTVGGMLTVVENYINNEKFCKETNLHYIATVIRANKITKIKTFFSKIPQIVSVIKKDKIDIVHVHMSERGSVFREGFVIWIAKIMGCKTIIHMHGATIKEWYERQNKLVKSIIKYVLCLPDRLLILGENWKPFILSVIGNNNSNKINVLYNAAFVPDTNQYNINATNVLFYGMLIQRKGIDDLLEAFSLILKEIPSNIRLVLYGDDHDSAEKIKDKIKRYCLEGRVEYKGWLTKNEQPVVFSNTIVNVLPSYNEGLPMTILESMGYGIPNISTDIAAIPEAIEDGENGYLVKPGDIATLADKMKVVINNKELRKTLSNNSFYRAKKDFSIEAHIERVISIYKELIDQDGKNHVQ